MNRAFCKVGMKVRVGFVLKRFAPGRFYLDLHELTGLEAEVVCVDGEDGLAVIQGEDGSRFGVEIEALQGRF